MYQDDVLSKISTIIRKIKGNGIEVNMDSDFTSMGFDSISYIGVIIEIENEFGFEFEDDIVDFKNIHAVSDLVNYIVKNGTK